MSEGQPIGVGMLVAMLAVWMWPVGAEALEVSVRGESSVEFETWTAGTTIVVEGRLYDDVGEALPGREVEIAVLERREVVVLERGYTDFFGQFATALEVSPGDYGVHVGFEGTDQVRGTSAAESVEVTAAPTQLEMEVASWVHGDDEKVPVRLKATAGEQGLPTFVSLFRDGDPVTTIDLDHRGRAEYDVGPYLEGGDNQLVAEIPGTQYRDEAEVTATVRRLVDPEIDGVVERVFRRVTRGVEIEVTIEDATGPVVDAEVEVALVPVATEDKGEDGEVDGERLVREVRTGVDGRATAMVSDRELGERRWDVTARVVPPIGDVLVWEGGEVRRESSTWRRTVILVAALVLAGVLMWMGRRGARLVWTRLKKWWRKWRRRGRRERESADEERSPLEAVEEVRPVVDKSRPRESVRGSTVTVRLWDEWRDAPVAEAVLEITDPEQTRQRRSIDAEGVVLELDIEGTWTIRGESPGYVPVRTTVKPPLEATSLRVVMTPVPLKIRQAYRWMMQRARGRDDWGRLTPRQIEAALAKVEGTAGGERSEEPDSSWRDWLADWEEMKEVERTDVLLRAITAIVEETNFSGQSYETEVWETTRRALEELVDHLQRGDGGRHEG